VTAISFRAQTLQNCSISIREPLNLLNHRIVTLLDDIPMTSKIKEIALRVLILVALPLLYLVASLLSMTANLIDSYCIKSLVLDDQQELNSQAPNVSQAELNNGQSSSLQLDIQSDEFKSLESLSRFSRRPQSSPHFEDLEAMIESKPTLETNQPAKFLLRLSHGYAFKKFNQNTNQNIDPYEGFTRPAPGLRQVSFDVISKGPNDVDDEVSAIFSKKDGDVQTLSDLVTNDECLSRTSSTEELANYIKNFSDNNVEIIYDSKPSPPPVIAYHPKSDFKVPIFPSKARSLNAGQVKYACSKEGITHVAKSDNLLTKFHALAAIQFLSKHFTKSCRAWDKREENLKDVSNFFAEIQKKSIEVAVDLRRSVALTLPEDFDYEEQIPDLFKDFKFDASENHHQVEIKGNSNLQFTEFITHLFTPLDDGGKPFALVIFDDDSAISYLAVDFNKAFLFDSTNPYFRLVDILGSTTSIIEKIGNSNDPKKVNFYFGALKTDI
jgi:hypothetical protein